MDRYIAYQFLQAARGGNLQKLRVCIRQGVKVDSKDDQSIKGDTALTYAAGQGHLNIVKELILSGAKVDLTDRWGNTALITAAKCGHLEIVRKLVLSGATVDHANNVGWTALMEASCEGRKDVIKTLLFHNADISIKNKVCDAALILAAREGHAAVVKELLLSGASVDLANRTGYTALIYAAQSGHSHVVRELLSSQATVDLANDEGDTALIVAAREGHTGVVKLLLSSGASLDLVNKKGYTALTFAAKQGHAKTVKELVSSGAKVDQTDREGSTALKIAKEGNYDAEIVKILKRAQRNIEMTGDNEPLPETHNKFQTIPKPAIPERTWKNRAYKNKAESQNESQTEAQNQTDSQTKAQDQTESQTEAQDQTDSQTEAQNQTDSQPEAQDQTESQTEAQDQTESQIEAQDQTESQTEAQNQTDSQTKFQTLLRPAIPERTWKKKANKKENVETDHSLTIDTKTDAEAASPPFAYPIFHDPSHPNVAFFDDPREKVFSSSGGHVDFDIGVEITVPPRAVPPGTTFTVKVQPSFAPSDVFVMPQGIHSASPNFLITKSGSALNGDVTLTFKHHVNVRNEEDAKDLSFYHADSSPSRSDSQLSVYEYEEVPEAKAEFLPGENTGKLTTRGFSNKFVKVGRRIKKWLSSSKSSHATRHGDLPEPIPSETSEPNPNVYTLRVYRSFPQSPGDKILALVSISILHPVYFKFLEKLDNHIIPHDYPSISSKAVDRIVREPLCFMDQEAKLEIPHIPGWTSTADQWTISKRAVDLPFGKFKPEDLHTYPPKIVCRFNPEGDIPTTCSLLVTGFNEDVRVSFGLEALQSQITVDTKELQVAAEELMTTALEVKETQLVSTVATVVSLMKLMSTAVSSSTSLGDIALHSDSIRVELQAVLKVARKVAKECSIKSIKDDIEANLSKMDTLSHQLCLVTKVKLKHCRDKSEEAIAFEDLINNGANLMKAVECLLKDIHFLKTITSPSKLQVTATADEIAKTVDINPHLLDCRCSKDDLLFLSRLIPDWLDFSIPLGLTEPERNGIRTDVQLINHSLKAHEMLDLWLKKGAFTPECHYRRLVEAALNQCTPDHKLAADICKMVANQA